ncbi:MAG: phosphoribosylanthranilate isomerase, partial [Candidatus Lambdaproteobacteria bacterium]|nr:phosphoribosylanthranilate isomerase [Candidatus Lambdaproteobacteria bacterium]
MTPRVKVCGITRLDDALLAVELGAAALGFVFYGPSPRKVSPEAAAEIVRALPPFVTTVGVFVQAGTAEMNRIVERCGLDRVQLHGGEPLAQLAELARPGYRAFRPRSEAEVAAMTREPDACVLLDTYSPELFGGTGRRFDWDWARRIGTGRRVILAGGLTPHNVNEAVRAVEPWGLDVSSSVEA